MITTRNIRWLLIAHASYLCIGGSWPLLHLPSFEAVTGPKVDDFLVRSVAGILLWTAVVLYTQVPKPRFAPSTGSLALGLSLVLGLVAVIGAASGSSRWVYFIDGAIHLGFALAWTWVLVRSKGSERDVPEYGIQ